MWLLIEPQWRRAQPCPASASVNLRSTCPKSCATCATHTRAIVVTHRGRPVAVIVPYSRREEANELSTEEGWARFFEVGDQLGREWKSPLTAVETLDDMR